jgi:hypothetical protein
MQTVIATADAVGYVASSLKLGPDSGFEYLPGEDGVSGKLSVPEALADQVKATLAAFKKDEGAAALLSMTKAGLKKAVDDQAEALRLTLITPGSGQAMEYQEAYAQAQAALGASGAVKPTDYPMLAATIGVDFDPDTGKAATDVLGVARSVKAAYEAYLMAGAAIRGARLLAKAEIEAAADADLAQAAFAAIKWPTFG